ncbi:HOAR [Orgyia pseudotsugata single capsid nuclopolyhedrovirus]|nr:HOAR [Orgyia pseudotsugata single capsid nuclopolyhedrovirus]
MSQVKYIQEHFISIPYNVIQFSYNRVTEDMCVYLQPMDQRKFINVGVINRNTKVLKFKNITFRNHGLFTNIFTNFYDYTQSIIHDHKARVKAQNFLTILHKQYVLERMEYCIKYYVSYYQNVIDTDMVGFSAYQKMQESLKKCLPVEIGVFSSTFYQSLNVINPEHHTSDPNNNIKETLYYINDFVSDVISSHKLIVTNTISRFTKYVKRLPKKDAKEFTNVTTPCQICEKYFAYNHVSKCNHHICINCINKKKSKCNSCHAYLIKTMFKSKNNDKPNEHNKQNLNTIPIDNSDDDTTREVEFDDETTRDVEVDDTAQQSSQDSFLNLEAQHKSPVRQTNTEHQSSDEEQLSNTEQNNPRRRKVIKRRRIIEQSSSSSSSDDSDNEHVTPVTTHNKKIAIVGGDSGMDSDDDETHAAGATTSTNVIDNIFSPSCPNVSESSLSLNDTAEFVNAVVPNNTTNIVDYTTPSTKIIDTPTDVVTTYTVPTLKTIVKNFLATPRLTIATNLFEPIVIPPALQDFNVEPSFIPVSPSRIISDNEDDWVAEEYEEKIPKQEFLEQYSIEEYEQILLKQEIKEESNAISSSQDLKRKANDCDSSDDDIVWLEPEKEMVKPQLGFMFRKTVRYVKKQKIIE